MSCDCMEAAFPSLICDIDTETFSTLGKKWIGSTTNDTISFVQLCILCIEK